VLLETDSAGHGNWEFGRASQAADTGAAEAGPLPVVKAVRMRDVRLTYKDGVGGVEHRIALEKLNLAADSLSSPLRIDAAADVNGEAIALDGTLGPVTALLDNKAFPIRLDIEALGAAMALDGIVNRPRDAKGYNVGFKLAGSSLSTVAERAAALAGGLPIPALADGKFSIAGALRDEGKRIAIDGLALTAGGSDLSGNLSLAPASPRLGLVAVLESSSLTLGDLIVEEKRTAEVASASPSDGRVFPDDPLPFDGLRGIDADVSLDAGALSADGLTVSDVSLKLVLARGKLSLDPFAATYEGQTVAGSVGLDASGSKAALTAALSGKGIDYGKLIADAAGEKLLVGLMDVDVDLSGKGATVRQIMATLNGKARIVTKDGRIESSALGLFSGDLLGAVPFLGGNDDAKALKCGVIDFVVDKGIAVPRAIVIETGGLNIIGSGAIDLRDEKLDLLFDPRAKKASLVSLAEIGIRVGGTFLEPSFGPDAGSVAKSVASTALGVATGGISSLAQMALSSAGGADTTDYCQAALSGKMPAASSGGQGAGDPPPQQPAKKRDDLGGAVQDLGGTLNNLLGN